MQELRPENQNQSSEAKEEAVKDCVSTDPKLDQIELERSRT